jgi:hypothetical protein
VLVYNLASSGSRTLERHSHRAMLLHHITARSLWTRSNFHQLHSHASALITKKCLVVDRRTIAACFIVEMSLLGVLATRPGGAGRCDMARRGRQPRFLLEIDREGSRSLVRDAPASLDGAGTGCADADVVLDAGP